MPSKGQGGDPPAGRELPEARGTELATLRIIVTLNRAGVRTQDPELARRVVSVLRRLNGLANGATSAYAVDPISSGKSEATPPPRVDSPFHHHLRRFQRAPNDKALAARVKHAETECDTHQGCNPVPRGKDGPENDTEAQERVIAWYEGVSAEEVAEQEGDYRLVGWVKKARRDNRRNESDGYPRRGWDGWDDETRKAEVGKLWNQGKRAEDAAQLLEISPRTLSKWWPGRQDRAA